MINLLQFYAINDPLEDLFGGLEAWCVAFNEFMVIFFGYLKYILAFVLLAIGILTLLKLRGTYVQSRIRNIDKSVVEIDKLDNPRLILGAVYIVIASGIIFDWFTYFLIWVLDPLPDRLIFNFINFHGLIDPYYLNRIADINAAVYPHEQTIYYCIALTSYGAITDLIIGVWYLINRIPFNPKMAITLIGGGITTGILTGFTTCLPLFL